MYEVPIAADLPSRRWELRAGLEDLDCSAPSRDDEVSDHDVRVPPSSFPLCVSAETFLDPRPVRPMQACTVSPQGRGLLGLGGRERLRLLLLEKHVVYETAEEGQDRTGLWILTNNSQRSDIIIFCIVGIICGFNLSAPWLLKWLLLQVLNLYVKQRWEKFSHHVGYKTETSRTLTFTFRVCHQNTWIRVDELVFFQNIWLHSLFMYIVITSTNKVLFSVVSVCWFVSKITQKLLDGFSWHLDWGWVSAQNGAQ